MQKQAVTKQTAEGVLENISKIASRFVEERKERQHRTRLASADFETLAGAGFLLTGVPTEFGGIYEDGSRSTRAICEMVRTLAHGDSSVALVATMHPAVIGAGGWLRTAEAPEPYTEAWARQREWVFQTALDGHWWGTIVSEPGSGGDSNKSKVVAKRGAVEGEYRITGQKHFGSGSQNATFMITTAVPEGEDGVETFFIDLRDQPWDGSAGVSVLAPWDGHGMAATQSHSLTFDDMPATRSALPRSVRGRGSGDGLGRSMFTAVIVGIVETAIETARASLGKKRGELRPYEQVEWSHIEMEGWLVQQAYEGMIRSVERREGNRNGLLGKESIAELAESIMTRICRTVGGGTFSRSSPFGFWFEDVRALGFLRPPWALGFDDIFEGSWE